MRDKSNVAAQGLEPTTLGSQCKYFFALDMAQRKTMISGYIVIGNDSNELPVNHDNKSNWMRNPRSNILTHTRTHACMLSLSARSFMCNSRNLSPSSPFCFPFVPQISPSGVNTGEAKPWQASQEFSSFFLSLFSQFASQPASPVI